MFCTKCGSEIKEGDLYCTNCGKKIKERNQNNGKRKLKKWQKISIVFFILIILIILAIIIIFLYKNKKNSDNSQVLSNSISTEIANSTQYNVESNNDDETILTIISIDFANTYRGFCNLCSQYGEFINTPDISYKDSNKFVVSIKAKKSEIDKIYEELGNNDQVYKIIKGFYINNEYKKIINQLLNNSEEKNGLGIEYGVVDINNDGITELILSHGKSRAEAVTEFYTYNNNKAIKLGEGAQGVLYEGDVYTENKLKLVYTENGGKQQVYDVIYNNNKFAIKEDTADTNSENFGEKIELYKPEEELPYDED